MPVLVAGRFVQGFGAGVVPAIGYVAIGRVYSVERAAADVRRAVDGVGRPGRDRPGAGGAGLVVGRLAVGVPRAAAVRRRRRVADRAGDDAPRPRCDRTSRRRSAFLRRRLVEAARVAAGAALVVAGFTASRWLLVPAIVGGAARRPRPAAPADPPGTLRGAAGLPAVVLSRGLLTFAFFGDGHVRAPRPDGGQGPSTFAGSIAVTMATLAWTTGAWVQERWIVRTGEAFFVRTGYLVLAPGIAVVAVGGAARRACRSG